MVNVTDMKNQLLSCDTFVALPPATKDRCVIFGKNSDRAEGEVQEIVYKSAADHPDGSKLQCTYVEIDQVNHSYAVILSKPAWMWGAEMGSNEHGVCVGNEAVWSKLNDSSEDLKEKLLGMDLVRLGLERSKTAKECLDVITELLQKHGQGGPCSELLPEHYYHNSFLICDRSEAWILETVGKLWAAEHITEGIRNISNVLTIMTKIDMMSDGLKEHAEKNGLWQPDQGDFNFAEAYGTGILKPLRLTAGRTLLEQLSCNGDFKVTDMFKILRDKDSGICMVRGCDFVTASSQVSILPSIDSKRPPCHWFTGTVDPSISIFKPFIFCPDVKVSPVCMSPVYPKDEDPAKVVPRFQKTVDRRHKLYKMHEEAYQTFSMQKIEELSTTLKDMELQCVEEVEVFLSRCDFADVVDFSDVHEIFKDATETESIFYK